MNFTPSRIFRQIAGMLFSLFTGLGRYLPRCLAAIAPFMLLVPAPADAALALDEIFDRDKVLDVQIQLDEGDWDKIRLQSRSMTQALSGERRVKKADSPFAYVRADVSVNGEMYRGVGLRKKGFIGSLDSSRPSLKVKFNFTDPEGQLAGRTHLTLNNNKQDGALVSQVMTYNLFRQIGLPASRASYAKVSVNGESLGVYSNVESVRKPMIGQNFESDAGTLFEGTLVDFFAGWDTGFEHKFGPEAEGRSQLKALVDALDGPNEKLVEAVGELVDLDAFLKFWALESLIGFWDGYAGNQNNFFVYHNPKSGKLHFLPWGADSVFTSRGMFDRGGPQSVKGRGRLASRLFEIPEIRTKYRTVMLDLLSKHWDEDLLLEETERIEKLVSEHVSSQQSGFRAALGRTREFFSSRRETIEGELKDGTPSLEGKASEPMYFSKIGRVKGELSGRWFSDAPDEASQVGEAQVEIVLNGEKIQFSELGVHAVKGRFGFRGPGQPNINIVGERASDGEQMTIMLMIEEDLFEPSLGEGVPVGGMLRQGAGFGFGPGGMMPIDGTIQISAAAQEDGAPLKATVSADIMRMVGGFFGRGGPPGRGGRRPGGPGRPGRPN